MQQRTQYDHDAIERRWQERWADDDVFRVPDDAADPAYVLAMFPYTSGSLHVGNVRSYTIADAIARYRRMRGEVVLHPMGWDAFGLPAENAAAERDTNPRQWTMQCIENMRGQFERMGFGYDWEREVTTCDPEYYRWNQWLFERFREAGLVERQAAEVNWCPSCETVLANEQVESAAPEEPSEGGDSEAQSASDRSGEQSPPEETAGADEVCWRCDTPVETRDLDQWFFTITDYADELLEALDDLDGWPANVREMQRNWIGRQEGATVAFEIPGRGDVEIFTTRLDTIHGATFFALSPGHEVAREIAAENDDVAEYVEQVAAAEEDEIAETSGVFTGEYVVNPATGEEIPVYVADYVLEDVGTGALYAVPAHDERDHTFAVEHGIEIRQVVAPAPDADVDPEAVDVREAAYTEDGVLVNSGEYDGLTGERARETLVEDLDGERRSEYRLRDWGISRQRYWGTPIPMIHCEECEFVPVPDEDLPVELPEFVHTTGNPLSAAEEWKHVDCPSCGGDAVRETDTMDTFVDSSWYFLRFVSPGGEARSASDTASGEERPASLADAPFDTERASDWLPVDQYVGGIEHAVMHLLYARFFTKVLDDLELLEGVREPFADLTNQGMVLGEDGRKMSKSRGNGVSPERIVEEFGADTARLFIMEAARPQTDFTWSTEGVRSAHDFVRKVHDLAVQFAAGEVVVDPDEVDTAPIGPVAEYVDRVVDAAAATATEEYEAFRFNRAMQAVRELVALLRRYRGHGEPDPETFERGLAVAAKLLAPVAPHVAEESWELLGRDGLVAEAEWPAAGAPDGYDVERRLIENTREDVRDIVEVAGIEDPAEIVVTVAPDWKHRVLAVAMDAEGNVLGTVMQDEALRERGEAAADYAKDLAARGGGLQAALAPEREAAALERAAWLLREEFDAEVSVRTAGEAHEEAVEQARPGRPAIDVRE